MSKQGFTLVEVLVAVLLAAFLFAAVWTSFMFGTFSVNAARHSAQAADLCEAGIENAQSLTQTQLQALSGSTVSEALSLDYSEDKTAAIPCTRTTMVADSDGDNVYEIVVTVSWTERYLGGIKIRQVTMQTQIANFSS